MSFISFGRWPLSRRKSDLAMLLLGFRRQGNFCRLVSPASCCYPTTRIHRAAHTSTSLNVSPYLFLNSTASATLRSYKGARNKVPCSNCARSSLNRVSFSMSSRRLKSSTSPNRSSNEDRLRNGNGVHDSHSHSIFGHSHGEDGHEHGHEQIMQALQGSGE